MQTTVHIIPSCAVPSHPINVVSYGKVLVWDEPLSPSGDITEYEIQFLIPNTQFEMSRLRDGLGTYYVIQDEDQLDGESSTIYFRVSLTELTVVASYLQCQQYSLALYVLGCVRSTVSYVMISIPGTCSNRSWNWPLE